MSHCGSSQTSSPSSSLKTDVEDDGKSTFSQGSGVPRADGAFHALQLVAGNRVRHGRCAPEFLEEMATRGANDSLRRFMAKKFKVMSGQEARLFFRNYISDHRKLVRTTNEVKRVRMPSPIAFAVTVWDGSVKCVDYYMTWRGFKKLPELERKIELLDAEFRRLVKKIDQEYNRVASLRMHENLSPIKQKFDNESDLSHTAGNSRPPPRVAVPNLTDERKEQHILPVPPTSATDSVMSLPLLNPVRNVPFSHRVPLRVTNPDRLSMLSVETLLPTLEKTKLSGSPAGVTDYLNSINGRLVPTDVTIQKVVKEEILNRTAGGRLLRTRSTKPSRLSRSSSLNRSENHSASLGHNLNEHGEKRPFTDEDLPEFLIVFLGDNPNVDTTSWHGLEKQSSIRTLPHDRHSPWIGPLARSDSKGADTDSENPAEIWNNSPLNPGPVNAYYPTIPVIPGAQYITLNQMGSPTPTESPYLYSSPHLDSPYIPWQLPIQHHAPHSRPPSQAFSIASHSSPFIYPSTPF